MSLLINTDKLEKIMTWAEGIQSPKTTLDTVIAQMEQESACLKLHAKRLKDIQKHIQLKHSLALDCHNNHLSVVCDGKIVSINVFNLTQDDRVTLKGLGFSWSKTKMEFVRKVVGMDVDEVRRFIHEREI